MHFALPPRKTSNPPAYARVNAHDSANVRRRQIQFLGYLIFGVLTFYLIVTTFLSESVPEQNAEIDEKASVLIVTVIEDDLMNDDYIAMVKSNRDDYARRHGYQTFYTNSSTYAHLTRPSPSSWAMVPALRNSLTQFPSVDYIWSLSPHAVITNASASLHTHIFSRLPEIMLKDIPVVPPDSVIHTFSHLKPSQIYLILTQDSENVAHTSFILRNTASIPVAEGCPKDNWSSFFLDAWFDPLFRAYAFQKAENHALEHIIQWHPTVLAKLAMVKQRVLNSYGFPIQKATDTKGVVDDSKWQSGDLIANLIGCTDEKDRDCMTEMEFYYKKWKSSIALLDNAESSDSYLEP